MTEKRAKPTRWNQRRISLSELTGEGPEVDRNAAIVALALCHEWTSPQLAELFSLSRQRISQIVKDFQKEFPEYAS